MAVYLGISNNGTFVSSDGYTLQDSDGLSLTALPATSKLKIPARVLTLFSLVYLNVASVDTLLPLQVHTTEKHIWLARVNILLMLALDLQKQSKLQKWKRLLL
jgi:hypothetical protein